MQLADTRHAAQRAGLRLLLTVDAMLHGAISHDGQRMDPVMSALVRLARKTRGERGSLAALRQRYAQGPAVTGMRPDLSVRTAALTIAGRQARSYEPRGVVRATMLYFHGGGFIMGNLDTHDPLCRLLAARAGLRVISVDYRLAPEHKFPAAHDDAAQAWAWTRANVSGRLLVGGDSAGANLAAGIGLSGVPALQVLIYPAVDLLHQDGRYPSIETFGDGFLLTKDGMRECAELLIPPEVDAGDPRLSPIRGELSRASPALVTVAGFDPLRDQGAAHARALRAAGVRAQLVEERGLIHGFADFGGVVPAARHAVDRIGDAIRAELEGMGL